jgi:hypothetical protein
VRARNGTTLRTRAWLRSSTPEEAAAARVRALLLSATGRPEGTLPLRSTARSSRAGSSSGSRWRRSRIPVRSRPARISWAFAGDGEPQVRHEMVPGIAHPGEGWSHTLTLDVPPGAGRLAVAVDDLARERWSGTVLTSLRNLPE